MRAIVNWFTRGWIGPDGSEQTTAPAEAVALRCIGLGFLVAVVVEIFTTKPEPALSGRGLVVLAGLVLMILGVIAAMPRRSRPSSLFTAGHGTVLALLAVVAAAVLLKIEQPHGIWEAGPYFVAIMAALRLSRRDGFLVLIVAVAPFTIAALIHDHDGAALSVVLSIVPWYLVFRLMHRLREQNEALEASRAAEASAAATAERGRLAREMHDVLAHSLSALSLQLETTRLLAREHRSHEQVTRGIDQAHQLAVAGLDDARRAIAAMRGEQLPGPDRIEELAAAFGDQSGVPVSVEIHGKPRELPPDARLAVYRTAQEALTNVRRHAAPQRVDVSLDYLPDSTVLVVEDHSAPGTPPPVAVGVAASGWGLTGMRERAALLGGELLATPTTDGFRVELRLPT